MLNGDAIGLVGAGALGAAIGRRLLAGGMPLVAWNRSAARTAPLAAAGATVAATVDDVVRDAAVVVVCLSDADAVRAVLLDGAVDWRRHGRRVVVNTSTIGADASDALTAAFAVAGVDFVEMPVSGGPEGALAGTLAAYVGRVDAHAAIVERLLAVLAGTVIRCDDNRAAQQLKVLNNLCEAINLWGAAEAIAIGRRLGLPLDALRAGLTGGRGDSRYLRVLLDRLQSPTDDVAVSLAIRTKDLQLAEALAGTLPPLSSLAKALFDDAGVALGASADQCACIERVPAPDIVRHRAAAPFADAVTA